MRVPAGAADGRGGGLQRARRDKRRVLAAVQQSAANRVRGRRGDVDSAFRSVESALGGGTDGGDDNPDALRAAVGAEECEAWGGGGAARGGDRDDSQGSGGTGRDAG